MVYCRTGGGQLQIKSKIGLAGYANLLAHQPVQLRGKMNVAVRIRLQLGRSFDRDRVRDGILVAIVNGGVQRQTVWRRELQTARADAGRQRPLHARRIAGITSVAPIDVPARLHGEDEGNRLLAAGGDLRAGGDHLHRQVLRLYRAGAAVTNGGANLPAQQAGQQDSQQQCRQQTKGACGIHRDHCRVLQVQTCPI